MPSVPMFPTPETTQTHVLVGTDPARSRARYTDVLGATVYRADDSSIVLAFWGVRRRPQPSAAGASSGGFRS